MDFVRLTLQLPQGAQSGLNTFLASRELLVQNGHFHFATSHTENKFVTTDTNPYLTTWMVQLLKVLGVVIQPHMSSCLTPLLYTPLSTLPAPQHQQVNGQRTCSWTWKGRDGDPTGQYIKTQVLFRDAQVRWLAFSQSPSQLTITICKVHCHSVCSYCEGPSLLILQSLKSHAKLISVCRASCQPQSHNSSLIAESVADSDNLQSLCHFQSPRCY